MKRKLRKLSVLFLSLALVISCLPVSYAAAAKSKNIIVYFPNWGIYNAAHKSMTVGMMPWDKITVVNHAFFEVDSSNKLASIDTFADFDKTMEHSEGWNSNQLRGHFGEYKYYKGKYPNVKILVSIGGWTRGENFHSMASSAANRAVFVKSLIDFLKTYPFIDGFDIDWEYPGINRAPDPNDQYDKGCPGGPEDKHNFTLLLKEIREAYNSSAMPDKILTIAASAGYDKLELQEPDQYAPYLDWLNVMTYDFHGAWETTTGHHAGLYANPNDTAGSSPVDIKGRYNTDAAMKNLTEIYKIPSSKLNAGTPYYSRGWKGVTGGNNGMFGTGTGAATGSWDNPQSPGGQYPYFTLKTMENANGFVKYRDDYAKTPWLYNAGQGILLSYEDTTSLSARCDYINNNGFGGLIVWDITGDTNNFEMTNLAYGKLIGTPPSDTVAAPVFSPAGGTYTSAQNVTISCATSGAVIRYTTDGTEPTSSSAQYSGAIKVSATATLKAKAFKAGMNDSATTTAAYVISPPPADTVAAPVFSPAGGTYTSAQNVTISCATSGAVIRYTTDGTEPTSSSDQYSGAIKVSSTATLKAKAFKTGMNDSATATAAYVINGGGQISPWQPNTPYKTGDLVSYNGKNYKCLQSHTSLPGWEPSNVPALWSEYGGPVAKTVADPSFSPAEGNYTSAQNVTISCATAGATVRYTTGGTEPSFSSAPYSGAIKVSATTTIKAKAFKAGMNDSATATAAYVINGGTQISPWQPNTPYKAGDLVSYNGKNYKCLQPHTSLPGWEPANVPALWSEYGGPVMEPVADPSFSPAGGNYTSTQNVTISCATADAVIRYTTDGTEPTSSSAQYSGAIQVANTTTIKAKAFKAGMNDSATVTATYIIGTVPPVNLPSHVLTGYWQNFDNGAKCLKISDVPKEYGLIAVAFADSTSTPGAITFNLDSTLSSKLGGYTKQQFISDIAAKKANGQRVILSVGGEKGSISVSNEAAAANFANSAYALMQEYGFDGVDIDLENGVNPTYMASALRQLSAKAGPNLIIAMAPQTLDMQNPNANYFKLALNIKDILTVVNTQCYNSGSMIGQDGKVYSQGSVDFLTALAAIQLENGLRPDQVGLGLPASRNGAGSGYVDPSVVNSALNCLAKGTASGGSYKPPRQYPTLRGAMTWSINWDASNNYNFAQSVSAALNQLPK